MVAVYSRLVLHLRTIRDSIHHHSSDLLISRAICLPAPASPLVLQPHRLEPPSRQQLRLPAAFSARQSALRRSRLDLAELALAAGQERRCPVGVSLGVQLPRRHRSSARVRRRRLGLPRRRARCLAARLAPLAAPEHLCFPTRARLRRYLVARLGAVRQRPAPAPCSASHRRLPPPRQQRLQLPRQRLHSAALVVLLFCSGLFLLVWLLLLAFL